MADVAVSQAFFEPDDVASALARLAVELEDVRKAVERGIFERMSCTKFDPPCYPGVVQWARTVRDLRETLVPDGWHADDTRNFSTVVRSDERVAISVSTGDEMTGLQPQDDRPEPTTKYPKGTIFLAAVNQNVQLSLLGPFIADEDGSVVPRRATWTLLIHTDKRAGEVRYELSLASEVGDDDRVKAWSERIIFDPLPIASDLPGEDDPPIGGIDVPVEPI